MEFYFHAVKFGRIDFWNRYITSKSTTNQTQFGPLDRHLVVETNNLVWQFLKISANKITDVMDIPLPNICDFYLVWEGGKAGFQTKRFLPANDVILLPSGCSCHDASFSCRSFCHKICLACRSPCRGFGEARRRQILMLNDSIASLTTISQEIVRLWCY